MAASCERLRHAWGVHAVHVREIKPGVVEPRLVGFDVPPEWATAGLLTSAIGAAAVHSRVNGPVIDGRSHACASAGKSTCVRFAPLTSMVARS